MSFDNEKNDYVEIEEGKNPFWFDAPIGRLRYFLIQLAIFIFALAALLFKELFVIFLAGPAIFLILIVIWISFVAMAKRIYDISGSLKVGVLSAIGTLILSFFIHFVGLVALIALCCVPGKCIKSNY